MRIRNIVPVPLLFVFLFAPPAQGQYVYLDANGDGVNDASDELPASGPIDLDIWFVTDHNRDGSPAVCVTDPSSPLTINSYEIVLEARDGRVAFGPMRNRMAFTSNPVCFAGREDTTSTTLYHNGWGDYIIMPPGTYKVATLTVEVLEGSPSLVFHGRSPSQPVDLTAFGTKCSGIEEDNTAILGEEFSDAGGIGRPVAEAGGPYHGVVGESITFNGSQSTTPDGGAIQYVWSFDDGGSAAGRIVTHTFSTVGTHWATLSVTSPSGTDDDVAEVIVAEVQHPIADAGGPYEGETGAPVQFNGTRSSDPDGDPLSYAWQFGDGNGGSGSLPHYIYNAPGEYVVTLTVSDGENSATDATTATIVTVIRPENRAPVAKAGGPYSGVIDRWIQFSATQSSDPDGDFLTYQWTFGDGRSGFGVAPVHTYVAAGSYTARVTVSDARLTSSAEAPVTITAAYEADAFFENPGQAVNVDASSEFVVVRIQPMGGSFSPDETDVEAIVLRVTKLDKSQVDVPADGSAILQDDSDDDGVDEFVARFPRATFRDLVISGDVQGSTPVELVGGLYGGGRFSGPFDATFVRSNSFDLTVTPNPFNPTAHLIIHSTVSGPMKARLFDIRGRHVKTILRGEPMTAGRHDLLFEARDDAGSPLASGIYFLQLTSREGTKTGRVVVAK